MGWTRLFTVVIYARARQTRVSREWLRVRRLLDLIDRINPPGYLQNSLLEFPFDFELLTSRFYQQAA